VTNWEQASGSFYTRLQEVARRSPLVRAALDAAIADGRFDHVARVLGGTDEVPVYVPIEVQLPDGARMRLTSLHGRLISVHDAVAEQFEVELLVPLDGESEKVGGGLMRSTKGTGSRSRSVAVAVGHSQGTHLVGHTWSHLHIEPERHHRALHARARRHDRNGGGSPGEEQETRPRR
jgi:hypothetical protein